MTNRRFLDFCDVLSAEFGKRDTGRGIVDCRFVIGDLRLAVFDFRVSDSSRVTHHSSLLLSSLVTAFCRRAIAAGASGVRKSHDEDWSTVTTRLSFARLQVYTGVDFVLWL